MQSGLPWERSDLAITCIGGPTALFEWGGLRFLTDPTFDAAGTAYPTNLYTLTKREGPAIGVEKLGHIGTVLLSHNHHYDNLDHTGRKVVVPFEVTPVLFLYTLPIQPLLRRSIKKCFC